MSVTHLTDVAAPKVPSTGQGLLDLAHIIDEDTSTDTRPVSDQLDSLARTDADGEAYWSARALLPLLGYTQWSTFITIMTRTRRVARNTDMDATFSPAAKKVGCGEGSEQSDWHLNATAAFLVTLSSDPYKSEVAAAQEYFTLRVRQAEAASQTSYAGTYVDDEPTTTTDEADVAAAVTAAMAPVMAELTALSERVARLESAPAKEKDEKKAAPAKPERKQQPKEMSLSKWRQEYMPEVKRDRLFKFLVTAGAMELIGTRPGGERSPKINMYRATKLGLSHGLKDSRCSMYVVPGREQDLKDFIESLQL